MLANSITLSIKSTIHTHKDKKEELEILMQEDISKI